MRYAVIVSNEREAALLIRRIRKYGGIILKVVIIADVDPQVLGGLIAKRETAKVLKSTLLIA